MGKGGGGVGMLGISWCTVSLRQPYSMWGVGWNKLVPEVSLGQLEGQGTEMWDVGWDRLVSSANPWLAWGKRT